MDMKKILQALDGASTKPVEGSNDMKKFLQVVTEGANPHKVSLPVQMAMQHYQEVKPEEQNQVIAKESIISKYFKLAEEEIVQRKADRKAELNQYASVIAERVRLKEGLSKKRIKEDEEAPIAPETDAVDSVTVDVPLLIRLLEYAREDAQTDMDLHNVTEQLITLSKEGRTLSMSDYEAIVGAPEEPTPTAE